MRLASQDSVNLSGWVPIPLRTRARGRGKRSPHKSSPRPSVLPAASNLAFVGLREPRRPGRRHDQCLTRHRSKRVSTAAACPDTYRIHPISRHCIFCATIANREDRAGSGLAGRSDMPIAASLSSIGDLGGPNSTPLPPTGFPRLCGGTQTDLCRQTAFLGRIWPASQRGLPCFCQRSAMPDHALFGISLDLSHKPLRDNTSPAPSIAPRSLWPNPDCGTRTATRSKGGSNMPANRAPTAIEVNIPGLRPMAGPRNEPTLRDPGTRAFAHSNHFQTRLPKLSGQQLL